MSSRRLLPLVPLLVLLCRSPACAAWRVPVSVYYETLCPFCSAFVVNGLSRIFRNGISSIAELRLVPFGNGRVTADGTITCQHEEDECKLNAIEACVIRLWPDAVTPCYVQIKRGQYGSEIYSIQASVKRFSIHRPLPHYEWDLSVLHTPIQVLNFYKFIQIPHSHAQQYLQHGPLNPPYYSCFTS